MDTLTLHQLIPTKHFDYQRLMAALSEHSHPRRLVGSLMKKGHIIRIKKGLYVWGEAVDRAPYSRELLANLVYGPSYVSLESALSFHSLIPERVATLTSVTSKKATRFSTPVGEFTYEHLHADAYPGGVGLHLATGTSFLIATPEKALLDVVALRGFTNNLGAFLAEDLRIDEEAFAGLDLEAMQELARAYRSSAVKAFMKELARG